MRTFLCMVLLAMLTACANPPSRYYSLASPDRALEDPAEAGVAEFAIRIPDLRVPEQVDRPQLVVRGDSATAVTVLNQSLWAAPLAEEIRAALAHEAARLLGVPDVTFMSAPARLPVWTVAVQIRRFELFAGVGTVLDATWTLSEEGRTSGSRRAREGELICSAVIRLPVDQRGVEPLVERQRSAVLRLAADIAQSITMRRSPSAASTQAPGGCTF